MMSLAVKLTCRIVVLISGLALVGGVSLWGLGGLSGHFEAAEDEYQQLRAVYEIGNHAALAKMLLHLHPSDGAAVGRVREQLSIAMVKVDELLDEKRLEGAGRAGKMSRHDPGYRAELEVIRSSLNSAYQGTQLGAGAEGALQEINRSLGQVAATAGRIRMQIVANRQQAGDRYARTVAVVTTLVLVLVPLAVWAGVGQYRGVMRPLRRLERGVQRVAEGRFDKPLPVEGDEEFARLSRRFNAMADQLDTLYRRMEEQVKTRSRQLVRSQRLASVGFLAAGLAHEINNPLGIIAGHAEAALQRLGKEVGANDGAGVCLNLKKVEVALKIIGEEAFRCKDITSKLLGLASPGADARAVVRPGEIAGRVVEMLSGLPRFREVDLDFNTTIESSEDGVVEANEGQLTQVLVNLVTNALEAVDPERGQVSVRVEREGPWVVICVEDNGRGMTRQVAQKIFEPFFTDKPRRDERGIGLGLSVAHAIVERHGGVIDAYSAGPGRGSRFTVKLPVARTRTAAEGLLIHA